MNNIYKLMVNETIKIYAKVGTWVMFGLLILIVVGAGLLTNHYATDGVQGDWREQLTQENMELTEALSEGNIANDLSHRYESMLAINEYRLSADIPPHDYNVDSIWGFAEITTSVSPNLIHVIILFTIIIAAGIVASEFSSGTIKLLLIRPFSRSTILMSKYLTTFTFALTLLVTLFITTFITGGILFGFGGLDAPHLVYVHGEVVEKSMLVHVIQSYGLSSIELLIMVTFAFMISAAFRSSSMSIGFTLFLLFAGQQAVYLLRSYDWVKYILFAHKDLRSLLNGMPLVEGMTLTYSLSVLAVYYLCFMSLAWYLFCKRDVSI